MRLALDTSGYIGFMRGGERIRRSLAEAEEILLPLPVLAELRTGFEYGGYRPNDNEKTLQIFLNSHRVKVLQPDDETTHIYARLFAYLRRNGRPIPSNDIWIAALAIQFSAILLTMDAHFEGLPKLAVLRPN